MKGEKMKSSLLLIASLSVFAPLMAQEIKIDEKFTGWTRNYKTSIVFDSADKVSKTGSLRLTAFDAKKPVDARIPLELEPKTKYEVTYMAKGEEIEDNRTGLFFNAGEKWERISRHKGTFGWTKFTEILDTRKVQGGKGVFHVTIFGEKGKFWVDQVKIEPAKAAKAAKPAAVQPAAKTPVPFTKRGGAYKNPDYVIDKASGRLLGHSINGKFSLAEPHEGHPVIRVESVFQKSWGSVVGIVWQQTFPTMEPGRYTFSVKYCLESEIERVGMYASRTPAGAKKHVSIFRKYLQSELPKPGKWIEASINFEVKPGDTTLNFFYCFWSNKPATVLFSDPRMEKEEE